MRTTNQEDAMANRYYVTIAGKCGTTYPLHKNSEPIYLFTNDSNTRGFEFHRHGKGWRVTVRNYMSGTKSSWGQSYDTLKEGVRDIFGI